MLVDHNLTAKTVAHVYTPGIDQRDGLGGALHLMGVDALGTVRAFINDDGSQMVTDTQGYYGYGIPRTRTGSDAFTFAFAGADGYQTDPNGLILLGNRVYHVYTGRCLTRDPAGAGDNDYEYCGDNPVNSIDPTGLDYAGAMKWGAAHGANPGDQIIETDVQGQAPSYAFGVRASDTSSPTVLSSSDTITLPKNPTDLGWTQIPHGGPPPFMHPPGAGPTRWIGPNGKGGVEHHPKDPSAPSNTHKGQDGYHVLTPKDKGGWQTGDAQHPVGTEIPNPDLYVAGGLATAGTGYLLWEGAKWGLAALAAPETGGLSLGAAALAP